MDCRGALAPSLKPERWEVAVLCSPIPYLVDAALNVYTLRTFT